MLADRRHWAGADRIEDPLASPTETRIPASTSGCRDPNADAVPALIAAVEGEYRRRTRLAGIAYAVAVVDSAGPVERKS